MKKLILFVLILYIHQQNLLRKKKKKIEFRLILFYFFFRMDCVLVLTLATGGQLKYPLRFTTLDAPPDDEITLEAVGLNKTSTVGFRLYSPKE